MTQNDERALTTHRAPRRPRPSLPRAIILAALIPCVLALAACGSEVTATDSTGGGTGGGTGASTSGSTSACQDMEGAYQLAVSSDSYIYGEAPWVWLHEEADGCRATVACQQFPGRTYAVTIAQDSVQLAPVGPAARGGHQGQTEHHLSDWMQITLARTAAGLSGTGWAEVWVDWNEEDIWGSESEQVQLKLDAPQPAVLQVGAPILPWRSYSFTTTRPVDALAKRLSVAGEGWTIEDEQSQEAVGVIEATARFGGSWDSVRGKSLALGVDSGLADLAGQLLQPNALTVQVLDIGPAIPDHELVDTSTLATWGFVKAYTDGPCSTEGCVSVLGDCGEYAGIGGQIDTTDMTELVVLLRIAEEGPPTMESISAVAEDGTALKQLKGGIDWYEVKEQEWVYDVAGMSKVGFAVEAASSCHGWGGPLIVERVYAR